MVILFNSSFHNCLLQITRNDPEHCLDRLNYLLNLFSGGSIRRPGISTNDQPMLSLDELPETLGLDYAWRSLLDSAIAQAERQFAYSIESTLPFAAVLATMLSRYPEQVVRLSFISFPLTLNNLSFSGLFLSGLFMILPLSQLLVDTF